MDLKDTWSRLVIRHLTVIVTTLLLGLGSVALLLARTHTTYVAKARIQAAATQPTSDVEAAALESQVQGIAGSPAVTGPALTDTHITADATIIAAKHVKVTRLGSSSLVDISVTMPSARTAVPLANAIAARTVSFLNDAGQQQAQAAINDIDSSTAALTKSEGDLLKQLSSAGPSETSAILTQLSGIGQQLAGLMTSRGQLVTTVHTAAAQLVDEALAAKPASRHVVTFLALGIIASLAIGLLIAAARETVQPTVPSGRIVAEMLGAPLVTGMLEPNGSSRAAAFGAAVVQGAGRRDLNRLQVLGPVPADQLEQVADAVRSAVRSASLPRLTVSVLGEDNPATVSARPGALLVVPRGVRVADLRPFEDLVTALEWPVLGVVELPRSRRATQAEHAVERLTVVDVTTPTLSHTPVPDDGAEDERPTATAASALSDRVHEPDAVTPRAAPRSSPSSPSALGNPGPEAFGPLPRLVVRSIVTDTASPSSAKAGA